MIELDAAGASELRPAKGDEIASAQQIPTNFLERILAELRVHGLVHSRRGAEGGYWLAKDPAQISVADIIRAVEGPLASVRGEAADELAYEGTAEPLRDVWIALRTSVRDVLENVSVADLRSSN
jgi:Rrf2 family protein